MNIVEIVVLFASQVFGVYFYWLKNRERNVDSRPMVTCWSSGVSGNASVCRESGATQADQSRKLDSYHEI
jgi:hypothetical protein